MSISSIDKPRTCDIPVCALRVAATIAAIGSLACSEVGPSEPQTRIAAPAPRLVVSDSVASAFDVALGDLRSRVLPSLGEALSGRVDELLRELSHSLSARDAARLAAAVMRAEAALAELGRAGDVATTTTADLDAVRLFLDEANALAKPDAASGTR
jgi:hypothetical protein